MSVRRTVSQVMTSTFAEERRETAWTLTLCLCLLRIRLVGVISDAAQEVQPSGRPDESETSRVRDGGQSARAAVSAISTIAPKVCSRSSAVVSSPVTMWSETVQIASAVRRWAAASV